ncbi:MAG: hypothetical protein N2170_05485 [Bacteroidia bacterium]|nr:hypothetical protein [Bacteroidia bacterium]
MEIAKELEDLLIPVSEEELAPLLRRLQEQLCVYYHSPISLLYIADAVSGEKFLYEAGAGLTSPPTPVSFSIGEGFLGQAAKERRYLCQAFPGHFLGDPILSALVEVEEITVVAIPLVYQDCVEGVWVLGTSRADITETLENDAWKEFLYKWAAYLQSIRSRRYIQALLEQSQVQNQELISREEELRQNLEELAVTQEEMRRTQQLMAERARWQDFVIDLFTLMASVSDHRFRSTARIFLAQLGQYVDALTTTALSPSEGGWKMLYSWKSRKANFELPTLWHLPDDLVTAFLESRTCTTRSGGELGLVEGPSYWVLVPYFTPQGVGGLLAIGHVEPLPLEAERARAYLHAAIAFFSTYERIQHTFSHEKELLTTIARLSRGKIETIPLPELEKDAPAWLHNLPMHSREAYLKSIQEALRQNLYVWQPPDDVAPQEICLFSNQQLIRLSWK